MRTLMKCVHGSHLYGLNTESSDVDYKGIFLPSLEDLLLNKAPKQITSSTGKEHEKNQAGDVDEVMFSLSTFIQLACDGETIALDMLHVDHDSSHLLHTSTAWKFIRANRHRFYTSNMKAFLGYAKKQAHKYGVKGSRIAALEEVLESRCYGRLWKLGDIKDILPINEFCKFVTVEKKGVETEFYEVLGSKYQLSISSPEFYNLMEDKLAQYGDRAKQARDNAGVDWKALSHAIRAGLQLREIYRTGDLKYPLRHRQLLLDIKQGKRDFLTEVQPLLEQVIQEVEELAAESDLPAKVDRKFWDDFLIRVYKEEYGI